MEPNRKRMIFSPKARHSAMNPRPARQAMVTTCAADSRAFSLSRAPRNWLVITAPPVARPANRVSTTLLIMSTRDTPEMAASPTEDTITPSAMPTSTERACSMTSGISSRTSILLLNIRSFCNSIPMPPLSFS